MPRRNAFTLVELLVVIAIIAVLLAILLPSLQVAKALSQRLVCKSRLGGIGKGVSIYAEQYDGKMPYPAGENFDGAPAIKTPYEVCIDNDHDPAPPPNVWMNLGCLVKSQLLASGKQLYCPANAEGMEEYERYQLAPDGVTKIAWGVTPNLPTNASTWWHVSTTYGYAFWPQARKMLTQAEFNVMAGRPNENPGARYVVGLPATPAKYSDMNPNKSLAADYCPHSVKGSGWNIQIVFGDGHVNMQKVPVEDGTLSVADKGKNWYPYQAKRPDGEPANKWFEVTPTVRYFYALTP